ncbi:MAG TPA: cupin domain-containing protein [Chthonomonadaceae bacterium]|nr:cupin domain-containing protein [Chthonomonadaceae bacterium]
MAEPIIAQSAGGGPPLNAAGQSFVLQEWSGGGPDYLHVHHADDEAWHVLEGTLTFRFPGREVEAPASTTVFVPAGVAHTYYEAHGPTRYLIILTPRLHALIQELHATPYAQHRAVLRKYDSDLVEEQK